MNTLSLHEFHRSAGAQFGSVNGEEKVVNYGDFPAEYRALREQAGILDFSFRSRVCLTGTDRVRFLHGQVTNDVKALQVGNGCYAALTTAKGRMQSDLNIYRLEEELLLDFEPGLAQMVSERLERFIVADDVQVVNIHSVYGLVSVQGPSAKEIVSRLNLLENFPAKSHDFAKTSNPKWGESYVINQPRLGTKGFDLFVPLQFLKAALSQLSEAAGENGRLCGWDAFEAARVEQGIPRFGIDMDETNFPQECGIEDRAVSYSKGCYIGQEVLNRIHTMGHVNRGLAGLLLGENLEGLPPKGAKLFQQGKEVGYVTSALVSPVLKATIALACVRNEANHPDTELTMLTNGRESVARVVKLPF